MNFLTNILRYPRFFVSSVLGLFLVLTTPLLQLFKEVKNKKLFLLLFFCCIGGIFFILNLMINPNF